ncbi:MAG: LacI family DNA-binding transcriptional regulator [Lachnospiraceae bacterium]|nr:LacI family DNA-binding transcriptional regulator [Lachnospiraceae bacterium]
MRKTTMQNVADALDISRVTVWKVLSGREGVSEDLQTKIITKACEMGYNVPDHLRSRVNLPDYKESARQYTISVTVSRPETSVFWMTIIHEIAKEASKHNINVMYTYLPSEISPSYELPSQLTNGTVQGMIILNVYNETLLRKISTLKIPKVFMDTSTKLPFRQLSGDLVLIEGLSGVAEIVDDLVAKGKKTFGFIGDINYAQTNYERYRGFVHSLEAHNLPIHKELCLTKQIGAEVYTEEIQSFINSLPKLPEAFICVSDFVASIVCRELTQKGLRIPEDICVSGFDGNTEFTGVDALTTVQVHNSEIGVKLVRQIIYRMEHPTSCHEICYLCSDVIFRHSTEC